MPTGRVERLAVQLCIRAVDLQAADAEPEFARVRALGERAAGNEHVRAECDLLAAGGQREGEPSLGDPIRTNPKPIDEDLDVRVLTNDFTLFGEPFQ